MSPCWKAYPFNSVNFGQSPTTPEQHADSSPCRYRGHSITCWDDKSLVRPSKQYSQHSSTNDRSHNPMGAEASSSVHHNLCHPNIPTPTTNLYLTDAWENDITSSEANLPTVPLDEDVWSEDPIPDRHLCIHETPDEPNHQCSYPCPYRSITFQMESPQSTLQNEAVFYYDPMGFSDISSDLPDIMITTSDNGILHLVDVSDPVWIA